MLRNLIIVSTSVIFCLACNLQNGSPVPGPDKQGSGMIYGMMMGAGSGAVSGAQLGAGAGPGALAGLGFGAVYGMLSGLGLDSVEEVELKNADEIKLLKDRSWAQEMLAEHYVRRLELHPNRDIYPADWFFAGDSVTLSCKGKILAEELAKLNHQRMPWSRLVIAVYSTASDSKSTYAEYLSKKRAEELALVFVRSGIEARRVLTKPVTVSAPVLLDPYDNPGRYNQAIEVLALDY